MAVVTGKTTFNVANTPLPASFPDATPQPQIDEKLLEQWLQAEQELELAQLKLDALKQNLISEFPAEAGEHTAVIGSHTITVRNSERWEWDQDILSSLFNSGSIPSHVKRNFRIERKAFERLDNTEKSKLAPALTRKLGPTKIKVDVL